VARGGRRGEALAAGQVALNLIPVVGPVVADAIAAFEERRRSQQVNAMIEALRAQLVAVNASKLDQEWIESPAFPDAIQRALEAGRRTSDESKRRLIAAVLGGAVTTSRPRALDVEALLDVLGSLTMIDLELARRLWIEAGAGEARAVVTSVIGPPDFPYLDFHLKRLEAAGLIGSTAGRHLDYAGQYMLTGTFHRLMDLLAAGGVTFDAEHDRA